MKKNSALFLFSTVMLWHITVDAQYRIIFFARSLPDITSELNVQDLVKKAYSHSKLVIQQVFAARLPSQPIASLFATYAGYVAMSSVGEGQIEFPRKQQRESFLFVVTPNVEPVMMLGKTVHHFEIPADMPATAYKIERVQDKDTGLYYWETTDEKIAEDRVIPLNSIVLFAQPIDIYVPLGITLTNSNPELVLPDVYVRSSFDIVTNAFNALKIKHFFEQIATLYKKGTDRSWTSQIVE